MKFKNFQKNKWFRQAITMKTIIRESYNSNGAVLRCKQHLYILMIENIVPIYIDLSTPKHPLAAQEKI